MPGALNEAVVTAACASAKVTVPGPSTTLQVVVNVTPRGNASSVTVPRSSADAGSSIVWSGPASTTGGWLRGMTVTVAVSLLLNCPSDAVSFSTYSPSSEKVAEVAALSGSAKVTEPGPLTFVQMKVRVLPAGRPSSVAVPSRATVSIGSVIVWSGPASAVGGRFTSGGGMSFSVI